jgi:hypothetical protein
MGPLEALSLLVMFSGTFSLSRSPLVSEIKQGDQDAEPLSGYRHLEPVTDTVCPSH